MENKIEDIKIPDLRKERESERIKLKIKYLILIKFFNKFLKWLNKNKWRILILILLIIIFNPTWSGTIIGEWINNFIGSIIKNINF
jgi:uncharacterized membrane protein (DUF441 family)